MIRWLRSPRIVVLSAALLGGCASTGEQPYVPATTETVVASLTATHDGRGRQIYVTNSSSEPIIVTSFRLMECKNINSRCDEERQVNVTVEPGRQRQIAAVEYKPSASGGSSFRYTFSWEPADPAAARVFH